MNQLVAEPEAAVHHELKCKWADLTLYALRLVVVLDPLEKKRRLCLIGNTLSPSQRRFLERMGFYEAEGRLWNDNLKFKLSQLANVFPNVIVSDMCESDIGCFPQELAILEEKLQISFTLNIVSDNPLPELAVPMSYHAASDNKEDLHMMGKSSDTPQLSIDLVPETCWFSNVRSNLAPKDWNKIRKSIFVRAGYKCEYCGEKGFDQGHQYPVDCHEIFEFDDDTGLQRLARLVAVCPKCRDVKHIEFTRAKSQQGFEEAIDRLARINHWTREQALSYYRHATKLWKERSKRYWMLDIGLLEAMGVNIARDDLD